MERINLIFTTKDVVIIDYVIKQMEKQRSFVPFDEFAKYLRWKPETRFADLGRLRTLSGKLAPYGVGLRRITRLGRGARAQFGIFGGYSQWIAVRKAIGKVRRSAGD